jgi:hypothetical protein
MRVILLLSALCTFQSFSQDFDFFEKSETFFSMHVNQGRVDYTAISKAPEALNELIAHINSESWTDIEEKAYLINAYNLSVINKIIINFPLSSPMDITDFFEKKDIILNGNNVSLNEIENTNLRSKYNDPRLHFALVCGAVSCPIITSFAYTPQALEKQLESQTKQGLNNGKFVYQNKDRTAIFISEIFKWYKDDFGENDKSVIEFINKYREADFPTDMKLSYYPYDWAINIQNSPTANSSENSEAPEVIMTSLEKEEVNLQTFTAGSLLGKNKFDFTLFNTLYTESKSNWKGQDFTGFRATFVTHLVQITYGLTKSKRINIGVDLNIKNSGRSIDSTFSGIGTAFRYTNTDSTRVGLTSVGARIKIQPFKAVQDFSIQSTFYIPTIQHPEGSSNPALYWAEWDRYIWWNQLFYTKTWGKVQVFTELDFLFRFKRNPSQIGMLDIPMSVFVSYFPNPKLTFYAMTQHVPRFTNNINPQDPQVTDWVIPMNYTASGIGAKYNLARGLNLEVLYTNFWRGKNSGLGSTFNLGIKYIML